jgi:prevent-host-death family protein
VGQAAFFFFSKGGMLTAPKKVLRRVFMLDITTDIESLTTFRRRSGDFIKQLKKSKRPVILTVNGKAAAIVQDAEAYQRLLDIAARADAGEAIRQGLTDVAKKRTRPAKLVFDEIRRKHAIPR